MCCVSHIEHPPGVNVRTNPAMHSDASSQHHELTNPARLTERLHLVRSMLASAAGVRVVDVYAWSCIR